MDSRKEISLREAVQDRFSRAAREPRMDDLYSSTKYPQQFEASIPEEVTVKDYSCGDPTINLKPGERVLDLGSGAGKLSFIAAQKVGPSGSVLGIDMNPDMLAVARRHTVEFSRQTGFANVRFELAKCQDLRLDLKKMEEYLRENHAYDERTFNLVRIYQEGLRSREPVVGDESVDVVVANGVVNFVEDRDKQKVFGEMFRVLRKGGRAVIAEMLADERIQGEMAGMRDLWARGISGAMTEDSFLSAFEAAGFYGIHILDRSNECQRINDIELRAFTVEAFKGKQGPCKEHFQAVIYKGPYKEVLDDDNHRLQRGKRFAVCAKTYSLYKQPPYAQYFEFVDPKEGVFVEPADNFPCGGMMLRDPRVTKGLTKYGPGTIPTSPYESATDTRDSFLRASSLCCPGGRCGDSC